MKNQTELLQRQIELERALDNIRTMSSNITKSDQLPDLVKAFYNEVLYRFFEADYFVLFERNLSDIFKLWVAKSGWKDIMELTNSPNRKTINSILSNASKKESSNTHFILKDTEKDQFLKEFFALSESECLKEGLKNGLNPNEIAGNITFSKNCGLVCIRISSTDCSKNDLELSHRLVNVFEQIFTRYLDLKKTEKYEKEAEIEEALEIVRARSLSMHHTSELQDLVNVVSEQLIKNQININGGVFITINEEVYAEGVPIWGSGGLANYVQKAVVPYIDNPIFLNLRDAIFSRTPFYTELIAKEHKIEFFEHLFRHSPWNATAPEIKKQILAKVGGYARSVTISKYTTIFMLNNLGVPFSDFDNETLRRFGKVLEQSYVRFLDLKKAEEQARNLAELEAAKNRLYTNITHEFRTPLTVISGMADQIAQNPEKWLGEGVEMINRNSTRLLQLVNKLLDLSKLENGDLSFVMQQSDIYAFVKYIVKGINSLADSKNIGIQLEALEAELIMDFDKEKIQQILVNLLSNAIKFTPAGGTISVSLEQVMHAEKPFLQITVKDSGIGIDEAHLPHIFNRFYQVDDSHTRKEEGSGIGLALVKELVQNMNGQISVSSKPKVGTTFEIRLPITNNEELEAIENHPIDLLSDSMDHTSEANSTDRPQILIVEDNKDVVTYISSCLSETYEIRVAQNGEQGIALALEYIPDLIITDVMMPIKDGYEVCHSLKNDVRTSHIPIIILTSKADIDSKLVGLEQGADAYLEKPFHKEELSLRIRKLLESRQKLQDYYLSKFTSSEDKYSDQTLEKNSSNENAFIKKFKEILDENIMNSDLSVDDFCNDMGMSHSQLHRKITAVTGASPIRFIRKMRLHKACQLLLKPELNISEIAYYTGFNDPGYFSRIFKQEFKLSPLDWRNKA